MLTRIFKRLQLKQALMIISIFSILLSSVVIALLLLLSYKDVMLENAVGTIQDKLSAVTNGIDAALGQDVVRSSEIVLYDDEINELLSRFSQGDASEGREKLVNIYLLNQRLAGLDRYGMIGDNLALLLDTKDNIYNVRFPTNEEAESAELVKNVIAQENKNYINLNWYPLMPNIFEPLSENTRKNYVVPITRNLLTFTNRRYYGKLVLAIYEEKIYDCYKQSSLMNSGSVYVVDLQGNLISHSDEGQLGKGKAFQNADQVQKSMKHRDGGYIDKASDIYVANRTLNNGQWLCIAEGSLTPIYNSIADNILKYIAVIIFVVVIAATCVVMLSHVITKPIYALMHSMHRAANRDFSVFVNKEGTKDTVKLIEDYNYLLQETNNLIYHEYEIKRRQQEAELDALVTQINPHFLYNTLESIIWQARAAGMNKISEMIYCLGQLFNITANKGKSMLKISKELEHAELYVKLQNMRYDDKFEFNVSLENDELSEYEVLKLILQPVIENAILHGFEGKTENCKIHVHVQHDGETVSFYVEDNGKGIDPKTLAEIQAKLSSNGLSYDGRKAEHKMQRGEGIGVINVHQRIRLYYGEKYGVSIESTQGQGTCVEITLPYLQNL